MMKMAHIIKSINQRGDQKVYYCNNNNYYHPIAYTILFVALNALIRKLDERVKKVSQYHQGEWAFCVMGRDYQSHAIALPLLKHHFGQFNQKVCSNIQLII